MVKQTVMTSVYGVTYIGARDQIKRRLKERSAIADEAELFHASCYAAKVIGGRSIDTIIASLFYAFPMGICEYLNILSLIKMLCCCLRRPL